MNSCPNTSLPQWNKLVNEVGELEAYRDFYESGTIRNVQEVVSKIEARSEEEVTKLGAASFIQKQLISFNKVTGDAMMSSFLEKLSSNVGKSYSIVSPEQAEEILKEANESYNGEAGFYFQDAVYLVKGKFNRDTAFHEFSHPIVDAIAEENPELFEKLYEEAISQSDLASTMEALFGEDKSTHAKKEMVVRALTKAATMDQNLPFVKKLLFQIKQFLRKLFGKSVKVSKLSEKTTVGELADMLKSENFEYEFVDNSSSDIVQFIKNENEWRAAIKDADANEIAAKIGELKNIAQLAKKYVKDNPQIEEALNIDKNKDSIDLLEQLLRDLGKVEKVTPDMKAEKVIEEIFKGNLSVLYQGVKDSQRILASLEDLSIDLSGDVRQDQLEEIMTLSKVSENIALWASHMVDFVGERVKKDNSFIVELNDIVNRAKQIEQNIYESLLELSTEFVFNNISKNLIENGEAKWNQQMARAKAKNGEVKIAKLKKEKSKYFITREDVKARLRGKIKDAPLGSTVEAYVRSSDPIVSSFAKWHLMNVVSVENKAQKFLNEMFDELYDEAVAVGYTPGSEQKFWSQFLFLDKSFRPKEVTMGTDDPEDMVSVEEYDVYSFLTPYKDYRWFFKDLNERINVAVQNNNEEEYLKLSTKKKLYSKFMYSEKNQVLKDAESIFQKNEYGEKAYAAREKAINKIRYVDAKISVFDRELDQTGLYEEKEQALRDYQSLFRVTNLDGTKKSVEDQEIAKILKEYREATRNEYTYEDEPGLFQIEYERFIESLKESYSPTSDKFKELRNQWIEENTEISFNEDHRAREERIYKRLEEISKLLSSDVSLRIDNLYEERQDLISGFKDNNRQVEANELDPKVQMRIKDIEREIEYLRDQTVSSSGFTKEQFKFISEVYEKREAGNATDEEIAQVADLYRNRISKPELKKYELERNQLLAELNGLKENLYSTYYLEAWQEHIDRIKEEGDSNPAFKIFETGVVDSSPFTLISGTTIEKINSSDTELATLMQDKLFKKWWNANHLSKSVSTFDLVLNKYVKSNESVPTSIWKVNLPKDQYLDYTMLSGEKVYRVPKAVKYKRRVLANPVEKVAGKTVSVINESEWLPNLDIKTVTDKDGNIIRNPFINDAYFELKRADSAKFKFLEKIKEFHVRNQEGNAQVGKLGYEVPRFERDAYDKIQNLADQGFVAAGKESAKDIKAFFSGRARQLLEQGLNLDVKLLINEGLVGDELNKIPLHGISKMDTELVNLNLFQSLARHNVSGFMHRMLIETSPTAQMLVKVLEDPKGALEDVNKVKRNLAVPFNQQVSALAGKPTTKSANSLRESLVKSLYERDWLGQRYADTMLSRANPEMTNTTRKIGTAISKVASNSYFAFNLSSALKNRFTAVLQTFIEAAAGEFINYRSLRRGKAIASKATVDLSASIFKRGPKSKNVQIIQAFNIDGQMDKTADPMYRTLGRDAASGSWALSARKLLEMNATVELLFGMLDFQKVELQDGTKISLYDALILKDNQLTIREDVVGEWSYDGKQFNEFKVKFQGVFDRLQGSYKDINQPMADRYFLFKQAAFMRKFFVPMFMRRFARERAQSDINDFEEGYYVSSFNYLRDFISYLIMGNKSAGNTAAMAMTAKEKKAFLRLGVDIGSQIVLGQIISMLLSFLFDYDEDDPLKKSKSKLRRSTGALKVPGLGIVDNREFNAISFFEIHLINQMMQVMLETSSFTPYGSKYGNIFATASGIYKEPFSSYNATFGRTLKAVDQIGDYMAGNATGRYTRRVGPTWYQQKHSAKIINTLYKGVGLEALTKDLSAVDRLESTMMIPKMIGR